MMHVVRFASGLVLLTLAFSSLPLEASCGTPLLITTSGYVTGPSGCVYCYDSAGNFSENGRGFFWGLGGGDPAAGRGNDSGTTSAQNWVGGLRPLIYPDGSAYVYAQYVLTDWFTPGVDGCITNLGARACTCLLLTDDQDLGNENVGLFALGSAQIDANSNSIIDGNLMLAPTPRPMILAQLGIREFVVAVPSPTDGINLDPACDCLAGATYRIYAQMVEPANSPAPRSRDRNDWIPVSDGTTLLGESVEISVDCSVLERDWYLAASIVFDSGFELTQLSTNSSRIPCSFILAEPEPLGDRKPHAPRPGRSNAGKPRIRGR